MAATYYRFDCGYSLSIDKYEERDQILFYDLTLERSSEILLSNILRQSHIDKEVFETLVLRGSNKNALDFINKDIEMAKTYIGKKRLLFTYPEYENNKHQMRTLVLHGNGVGVDDIFMNKLCDLETTGLLNLHSCINSAKDTHYILPSGVHVEQFVRIGNMLFDGVTISRISDWILQYLNNAGGILGDIGPMFPLVQSIEHRYFVNTGNELPTDCLSKYPSDIDGFRKTVELLLKKCDVDRELIFLVSVNSSNRLINLWKEICGKRKNRIIIILETASSRQHDSKTHVLSNIDIPISHNFSVGTACIECSTNKKHEVAINPETYEPEVGLVWIENKITIEHLRENITFWSSVNRTESVMVHYADTDRRRHFHIYVDVGLLLGDREFRQKCFSAMGDYPPAAIVIIPKHNNSSKLKEFINEASNDIENKPDVVIYDEVDGVNRMREILRDVTGNILIFDDALITGHTMRILKLTVHAALRQLKRKLHVDGFVLLGRPPDEKTLKSLRVLYKGADGSKFKCGEVVFMPSPGNINCPWCDELAQLKGVEKEFSGSELAFIRDRIEMLSSYGEPPPLMSLKLRKLGFGSATLNSFLGDVKEVTGYSAVVCVVVKQINMWGENKKTGERLCLDLRQVLNCYFEPCIISGIFRTIGIKHLAYSSDSQKIEDFVVQSRESIQLPGLIGELIWACANAKLPTKIMPWLMDQAKKEIHPDIDGRYPDFIKRFINRNQPAQG